MLKNKKIFLGGAIFISVFLIFIVSIKIQSRGIALGDVTIDAYNRPKEWQNIIAKDINYDNIRLKVDGKEVTFDNAEMYMDENMDVMIPVYIFRDVFKCAVNVFNEEQMVLQKGTVITSINVNSDYIAVNEQKVLQKDAYNYKNGVAYVNAMVLKKAFSYDYSWDAQNNILSLVNQNISENILPAQYNYRQAGRLSLIKNQGNTSSCWAFASLSALETSLMPKEQFEMSVDNMVGNSGYINYQNEGGDYTRAMAYLAAWQGPVLEQDDIYGDGILNKLAQPVKHVQEIQIVESKNLEAIKKAVFLWGGVESSLYTSMNKTDSNSIFYNNQTNAYCYIGTQKPNHDIVIVGWDDNYSKDNFSVQLEGNGAFICMNSWGTNFGDEGLFYVSYYDSNIGIHNVVYTGIEDIDNYDNIYQSDICGWVGQLGYEEDNAYFSNVYTANKNEQLEAIGFYATDKNTSYEIYTVEDFIDASSFENMKCDQTGTFSNAGYYTVKLNTPVYMESGKKYAVIVKIKTPGAVHPIAIEYVSGRATRNVILDDGEGYISYTGKTWEHVEESKNCNICLKMYSKNIE